MSKREPQSEYDLDQEPIDPMAEELDKVRLERDEFEGKFLRAMADCQNTQRRAVIDQQLAREQGKTSVVERLLPVLDQFDMALSQGLDKSDAEAIAKGVRLIRDELMRAVQSIGVTIVAPQAGDEFDPSRHEAMTYQPAEGIEAGKIVTTYRFGYALGDRLIRAAQVTIAAEAGATEPAGDTQTDEG